jgi:hypothetical protein
MVAMEQHYEAVMAMPTSRRYRFALKHSDELKEARAKSKTR